MCVCDGVEGNQSESKSPELARFGRWPLVHPQQSQIKIKRTHYFNEKKNKMWE